MDVPQIFDLIEITLCKYINLFNLIDSILGSKGSCPAFKALWGIL